MKNKVMGKALSWVLSAAMALTMSGAIPAMTSTVYAVENEPVTVFADKYAKEVTSGTLNFGATSAEGAATSVGWTILSNNSGSYENTKGVLNIQKTLGYASSSWNTAVPAYFSTAQLALFKSTTINKLGSHNFASQNYNDGKYSATIEDPGVSGLKFYLPSAYETTHSTYANSDLGWTRDTLSNATSSTDGYAVVAKNTDSSQKIIATAGATNKYYPVGNLDLTDRTKTLLATTTGTNTTLTMIDTSIEQPAVKSVKAGTAVAEKTPVTVTLTSAPTDKNVKVGWFISSGDYTVADSTYVEGGSDISVDSDTKTFSINVTTSYISDTNKLYVYYYKVAADTVTSLASTPFNLTDYGKIAPTSSNFTIDDFTYTGVAYSSKDDAIAAIGTNSTADITAKADEGYTITDVDPTITVTAIQKDGKDIAPSSTSKVTFKAGETYTLIGTVSAFSETKTSDSSVKEFALSTKVVLGTMKIAKLALTQEQISFTLPAVDQYAAASSLTYTLASLKLKDDEIATDDTVNATNVKCTFANAAATDTASDTAANGIVVKVSFSTLDNSNYSISGTNFVLTGSNASLKVAVTAQAIKSVKLKSEPTTMNYVEGNSLDPAGMIVTVTYNNGKTKDFEYADQGTAKNGYWTITPDCDTTILSSSNPTTFTVKWAATDTATAVTAGTFTPTVSTSAIALTNISIPKSYSVNKDASISAPIVSYYPSNTTAKRTVSWKYEAGTGAVEFYNVAGDKITTITSGGDFKQENIATIKGVTAGTVKLTAKVGDKTAVTTITVNDVNNSVNWSGLYGDDRYATAAKIAKAAYPSGVASGTAILVNAYDWPDGLSASGFAGALGAPILITDGKTLTSSTADLIKSWNLDTIYIIGGPAVMDASIKSTLTSSCNVKTVEQIYGADRYETAANVYSYGVLKGIWSTKSGISNTSLVVTSGSGYADALSISPWTYYFGMPILLADKGQLTGTAATAVQALSDLSNVYVIGGPTLVSAATYNTLKGKMASTGSDIQRIYGDTRYDTSAAIAKYFVSTYTLSADYASLNYAGFATGEGFADALVSSMLLGKTGTAKTEVSPLILVDDKTEAAGAFSYVADNFTKSTSGVTQIEFLDGAKVLTSAVTGKILNNWNESKENTSFAIDN